MVRCARHCQRGITTVEFAIVGALFFLVLFAVIEFGRLLFVWNLLDEATRRAARMATVCPTDAATIAGIRQHAVFDSGLVAGLASNHIEIEYLRDDGSPVAAPADPDQFGDISFVRAAVNGYQHAMLIPFFDLALPAPSFATVLSGESLGVHPAGAGEVNCPSGI